MRRLFLAAVMTGLALGGALDFLVVSRPAPDLVEATALAGEQTDQRFGEPMPNSHENSNTSGDSYSLNSNVINGQSTTICTTDLGLEPIVKEAIDHWQDALEALAYDPLEWMEPDDLAIDPCAGTHVVVTQSPVDAGNCSSSARACYLPGNTDGERVVFSMDEQSTIYYQVLSRDPDSVAHLRTMIHELGHALGLGHYDTTDRCGDLRDADVNPTNQADSSPGDHYSVMVSEGGEECGTQAVITGRDLRDFFEAYHVGAITGVAATVDSVSTTEARLTLSWLDEDDHGDIPEGLREASHGATYVLVQRLNQDGTWSEVDNEPIATGEQFLEDVSFTDANGLASQYRLRAVSEALAGLLTATVKLPGEHLGLDLEQGGLDGRVGSYSFGDPTYIGGFTVTSGSGASTVYHTASVSVSPAYCYAAGGIYAAGSGAYGPGMAYTESDNATVTRPKSRRPALPLPESREEWPCGDFTVTVNPDVAGVSAYTITVPVEVLPTPPALQPVLWPSLLTPTITVTPNPCSRGDAVTINKVATGDFAVYFGAERVTFSNSSATLDCPLQAEYPNDVRLLALRPDGGGEALSSVAITGPLAVTSFSGHRYCTAGSMGRFTGFTVGGGVPLAGGGYKYAFTTDSRVTTTEATWPEPNQVGDGGKYDCPAVDKAYEPDALTVTVTDADGRTATAMVTLHVHLAAVVAETPTAVTTSEATLTWPTVSGATRYRIGKNAPADFDPTHSDWTGAPGDLQEEKVTAPVPDKVTVTVTGLAAGTVHTVYILAEAERDDPLITEPRQLVSLYSRDGSGNRWTAVEVKTECSSTSAAGQSAEEGSTDSTCKPPKPTVTIEDGTAINEGDSASFTLTRTKTLAHPFSQTLTVQMSVSQRAVSNDPAPGDMLGKVPPTAKFEPNEKTATYSVPTTPDAVDESDVIFTAQIEPDSGTDPAYEVGTPGSAEVRVRDNDESCTVLAELDPDSEGRGRVSPKTSTVNCGDTVTLTATADEGHCFSHWDSETASSGCLERKTKTVTTSAAATSVTHTAHFKDDPTPTITIAPVAASVPESAEAEFRLSRLGAASAALTINVSVGESGDMTVVPRPTTVPLAANARTALLTVPIDDDEEAEDNSLVSATVRAGTGYKVSANAASASLTVEDNDEPAPTELEARIKARKLSSGRFEVILQYRDGDQVLEREPSKRFANPSKMTDGEWDKSSALTVPLDGTDYAVGQITARLDHLRPCPSRLEFDFFTTGGSWSSPKKRFMSHDVDLNVWKHSSWFSVPLTATAAQGALSLASTEATMETAAATALAGTNAESATASEAGLDGGSMSAADELSATVAAQSGLVASAGDCLPTPSGLAATAITATSVSVEWSEVSGAGAYDVRTGTSGQGSALSATARSHSFDALKPSTSYTLQVRARDYRGGSSWASLTESTADPTITIERVSSPITEGATAQFRLTADAAPTTDLTVSVGVSESGATFSGTPPGSVTIAANSTSAILDVETSDDATEESNSVITATLNAGTGYTVGSPASATVTARDNDGTPTITIVRVASPVTEGANAQFTISSDAALTTAVTVSVGVSETGSMISGTPPGSVTIAKSASAATLSVATTNDSTDESDSVITAQVNSGTGYTVGSPSSATVTAQDNDTSVCGSKPAQPAPDTQTVTVSTSTAWEVSGSVANKVRTTVTQAQVRTYSWTGPPDCVWRAGPWVDDGSPTTNRTIIETKSAPASTRTLVTTDTEEEYHSNGRAARTKTTTTSQPQSRTFSFDAVNEVWVMGPWTDDGAPTVDVTYGPWYCASTLPEPEATKTEDVVTTNWSVSSTAASKIETTTTTTYTRSVTETGPTECGWGTTLWLYAGEVTSSKTVQTIPKPADDVVPVPIQTTTQTRWVVEDDGLFCIMYEEQRSGVRYSYYYRPHVFSVAQEAWVDGTRNSTPYYTDPPGVFNWGAWSRTGASKLCPQSTSAEDGQSTGPAAQLSAGAHLFQWGTGYFRFTVPNGATVELSARGLDSGVSAIVFTTGAEELVVEPVNLPAADAASGVSAEGLSDPTLQAIADSLRQAAAPEPPPSSPPSECAVAGAAAESRALDLEQAPCLLVPEGGRVSISAGAAGLSLTLSAGRAWLVVTGGEQALRALDLASGGQLTLSLSDGAELNRALPAGDSVLAALFDAIVASIQAAPAVPTADE